MIGFHLLKRLKPVDDDIVLIEEVTTGAKKTVKLANLLGGGGGGGGSTAWIDGDVAPYNSFTNGLETKDFDYEIGSRNVFERDCSRFLQAG
jgi:hypothetical protein